MNNFETTPRTDDSIESLAIDEGLDPQLVRELLTYLHEQRVHPILIFGTVRSGKTLMILSLLHYAKQDSRTNMKIRLGEPIFPSQFPFAEDRYRDAEQF